MSKRRQLVPQTLIHLRCAPLQVACNAPPHGKLWLCELIRKAPEPAVLTYYHHCYIYYTVTPRRATEAACLPWSAHDC